MNYSNDCTLIVNGHIVEHNNLLFYNEENDFFVVPILTIVRALGGNTKWYNKSLVIIELNQEQFVLNPAKNKLIHIGSNFSSGNLIVLPGGASNGTQYNIIGKEFVLNDSCTRWFFRIVGVTVCIDRTNCTIDYSFCE